MQTRRNFNECAKAIAAIANDEHRLVAAKTMADLFAADNPHFNRERFMAAAGCVIGSPLESEMAMEVEKIAKG